MTDLLFMNLFLLRNQNPKGSMMNIKVPLVNKKATLLKFSNPNVDVEPDLEMLEIEEAKKLFEDRADLDDFWSGRLLADRKSTRVAA